MLRQGPSSLFHLRAHVPDIVAELPSGVLSPPDSPHIVDTTDAEPQQRFPEGFPLAYSLRRAWGAMSPFLFLHWDDCEMAVDLSWPFPEQVYRRLHDSSGSLVTKDLELGAMYAIEQTIGGHTVALSWTGVISAYVETDAKHQAAVEMEDGEGSVICPITGVLGLVNMYSGLIRIWRYE